MGPFQINKKIVRRAKSFKCYVVLFICLNTKALHLEPVPDIIAMIFINVFKRYTLIMMQILRLQTRNHTRKYNYDLTSKFANIPSLQILLILEVFGNLVLSAIISFI